MKETFKISGVVTDTETGQPLAGLTVKAYDKDLFYDDLLGNAVTDKAGRFEINYSGADFRELFDKKPDIYFRIIDKAGKTIHTTADSVRWNTGADERFEIRIPLHKLPPAETTPIEFLDTDGKRRTEFEAGESLLFQLKGLRPDTAHLIRITDDGNEELFNVTLIANRFGVIAPTVVWPDIGIGVPEKGGKYAFESHEKAAAAMANRTFTLEISEGKKKIGKQTFRITPDFTQRKLFSSTESGNLKRGILVGEDHLRVQGKNFTPGSLVDVYLVKRQFNWKGGDAIIPVRNEDGSEVVLNVELKREEKNFNLILWPKDKMRPGSYDIIARELIPHEYLGKERVFRASDIISDRHITSVVIRDDIFHYKPVHMGCVMAMKDIAAKMLWGVPEEVLYTNNFPRGTDVWAALDPAGLMPGDIGKKIRYYVVAHKDAATWDMDSTLVDVTGNAVEIILSDSCVNANAALVWSNPQVPGKYDLVVDFGNNAPDPVNFIADNSFDPPADMIDGYFNVGFYVTDDPSVPGTFSVGQTTYNDPAVIIPAVGVWYPNPPGVFGNTPSNTLNMPMIGRVRYPADANGVNVPVSAVKPNYPLVVVMHGQHTTLDPSFEGYDYLLDHLASHGYIAVSIDCNEINAFGGAQDTRAHAMLEHIALLNNKNMSPGLFSGKIDMSNIAIMGHSRGGDGVVQAEVFNQSLGLGWNIKAVIPLAPTDFSGTSPSPLVLATSKLLCIYGSNDGDVWGGTNPATKYTGTGFRFYDRATVEKAMVFIEGATHNRFNTEWGTEGKVDATSPKILSVGQHQQLLCGYMTAFLQVHIEGRTEQRDYFTGELKIPQVSGVVVHSQYGPTSNLTLDDFETNPATNLNTLNGGVTPTDLDMGSPQEDDLRILDTNTPHQKKGLRLKWSALTGKYESVIPIGQRNISNRKFLSFRVSQKVASGSNPVDQLRDMRVRLTMSGGGNSRALRVGYFGTIPYPYKPEYIPANDVDEAPNTKAALKTIRIPLYGWTIKCLNVPIVDLTDVESVTFEFDYQPTGELLIDDIEFTS